MLKSIKDLLHFDNIDQIVKTNQKFSSKKVTTGAFDFLHLVKLWPDIVGEVLAKHTIPIKNSSGTLTVLSNHSAFSHQMSFMQETLIKKIIKVFPQLNGKIKKINFQVNSAFFIEKKKFIEKKNQVREKTKTQYQFHPQSPVHKKLKKEALLEFSQITDLELKEVLISLYIQDKLK